jgi:predicted AAA+ superfamily ATPase
MDDLGTLALARADPQGFVEGLGERAVLDEIQRAPELLLPIKRAIDLGRRAGRFILTGSANVLALPRAAESLAGRMEVLTLWPLAQCELGSGTSGFLDACFQGHPEAVAPPPADRASLLHAAARGGYPEVAARASGESRSRWFDAYLSTLLQRDLRDLAAVERLAEVPRLLEAVAARTGGTLNVADLSRTVGMAQVTLHRYLALLEALYLVFRLPAWSANLGKRLVRAPKLHLADPGLLVHLLGLDADELAARPSAAGPALEAFVAAELLRLAPHAAARPRLYHLRTAAGLEVDVVLEARGGDLVGVEVKAGAAPGPEDFRGLRFLEEAVGPRLRCGVVLHAGRESVPFGPRLWALPISALWASPATPPRR